MPASHLQIPPPVAQILIASGFSRILRRTAFRRSHGLSTHSAHGCAARFCSMESLCESPCPAVAQNPSPVATMRGPFITPASTMFLICMPNLEISPTVVRPDSRHSCACCTATTAFWMLSSSTQSLSFSVRLPEKCRCASTRPGMIVLPVMSTTSYPSPSGMSRAGPA